MGDAGTDADRRRSERAAEAQEMWLVRRHDLLMDREVGVDLIEAADYRAELDRRVTMGYAERLDRLTTRLVILTVALVILTAGIIFLTAWLIGIELGIVEARH